MHVPAKVTLKGLKNTLNIADFGGKLVSYEQSLVLQQKLAQLCKTGSIPDTLLQLQHFPVYTLGKRGQDKDFLVPEEELRRKGAEVFRVGRGGETTFHGPRQLVGYPIVNLRRLGKGARAYVEALEDTVVCTLQKFGIDAQGRQPAGRTGVWIEDRKIAALGVQISHATTSHGFALNVSTDLNYFDHIVPCGLSDFEVTSMAREKRCPVSLHSL